jgi:uncharacterized protein YcbK (DUF882 family)
MSASRRRLLGGLASFSVVALAAPARAFSSRGERVLSFFHTHTRDRLTVPYYADGSYLPESLARLDRSLRDHRTGDEHPIDPTLFDILHDCGRARGRKSSFR